jgi:hypothetical protein
MSKRTDIADELDPELLLARSMAELEIKTTAHDVHWHLGEAEWWLSQDDAEIVFTAPGDITVTCPLQIVGSYNPADATWLWAWDHPYIAPPLREAAEHVRRYGQRHGVERLTKRKFRSSEKEAWEFAALACKLTDAQGAYRCPLANVLTFVIFGEPCLTKSEPRRG